MTLTPWDLPAPSADDPGPRTVIPMRPIDMAVNVRDDETRRAIEARLTKMRHVEVRPTFRDDLAELVSDIRSHPELATTCTLLGFILGLAVTVGLAELIVRLWL